ncbi:MAG: bacillithiol system redox-active protein YtxJ [Rhodothermia bacterium]|nr:bacillithiol system redox-active protein YtxJ [Rhodothermia bacterium]
MLRRTRNSNFDDLSTEDHLEVLLKRSHAEPVIIYKHSDICGLSNVAQREVSLFASDDTAPVYKLVVQRARHVSNAIESLFGIRHESPQAIVVRNGRAVYDASHRAISAEALAEALNQSRRLND